MQTKSKRLSNETSSIDTDVDWDCENDDKQPDPKKKRASYDQNDYDDPYNKILKELHKLNKKETRNAENIKAIALKMMEEEDDSESFKFPLFNKEQYEKFKHCLSRKRFTNKLIAWLEKRIINNVTKVSDLVESVFHPNLLKDFTACGLQGRDNFENTKINQIFFDICKMTYKEYHSDLTKVINKIHMRYRRHHHEYNLI